MTPHCLSAMFRSGDLPFRPRGLAMYAVVKTVKDDPVRAVQVYQDLLRFGGTDYAATLFLGLLRDVRERPFWLREHLVVARRKVYPMP